MPAKARRLRWRGWQSSARRALLAACLWPLVAGAAQACASMDLVFQGKVPGTLVALDAPQVKAAQGFQAWYADLTPRYGHAVLGDGLEPATLGVWTHANSASCGVKVTLDPPHVFEDVAPRLADLDGDGLPEIIVVRSHEALGAQLAVYTLAPDQLSLRLLATTPYIGTRFRWLAPLGAADLDGDGAMELAYVDRPHLAKTLRIWRFEAGALREVASLAGVTNHRIGEVDIAGGIRDCGQGPEMILSDAAWSRLLALRFAQGEITARTLSDDTSRPAFARAMACQSAD